MSVTVTPQDLGTQEATSADVSFTSGDDPTFVEVDILPVLVAFFNPTLNSKDVQVNEAQSPETPPYGLGGPGTFTITANKHFYHLMIQKNLSDSIINDNASPPVVKFSGSDLVDLSVASFKFDAL